MSVDFSENFMHTTTFLETDTSTGTGFFYEINHPEISGKHYSQFIATNKHVIAGASKVTAFVTKMKNGFPVYGEQMDLEIDLTDPERTIYHPDPNVDLCLIDITDIRSEYYAAGKEMYILSFDPTTIPTKEDLHWFNALEDVVMVGYPSGLWDDTNNLPIMRKGVTSSHLSFKFKNREIFLADIACYRGSSGSPLFIHNDGKWIARKGHNFNQSQILLVGIAYALPVETSVGDIVSEDIPTKKDAVIFKSDLNLGYFVKSYKLLDFIPIVKEKIRPLV